MRLLLTALLLVLAPLAHALPINASGSLTTNGLAVLDAETGELFTAFEINANSFNGTTSVFFNGIGDTESGVGDADTPLMLPLISVGPGCMGTNCAMAELSSDPFGGQTSTSATVNGEVPPPVVGAGNAEVDANLLATVDLTILEPAELMLGVSFDWVASVFVDLGLAADSVANASHLYSINVFDAANNALLNFTPIDINLNAFAVDGFNDVTLSDSGFATSDSLTFVGGDQVRLAVTEATQVDIVGNVPATDIPSISMLPLMGLGLMGLVLVRRRA